MTNIANGSMNLEFSNSVLMPESSSLLYCDFILNLCIVYELNSWLRNPSDISALKHCLLGTFRLTRNVGENRFTYNGWGIALDGKGMWSFGNSFTRNVAIFSVDDTPSSHSDNQKINFKY